MRLEGRKEGEKHMLLLYLNLQLGILEAEEDHNRWLNFCDVKGL